jgi:hypothetical protein
VTSGKLSRSSVSPSMDKVAPDQPAGPGLLVKPPLQCQIAALLVTPAISGDCPACIAQRAIHPTTILCGNPSGPITVSVPAKLHSEHSKRRFSWRSGPSDSPTNIIRVRQRGQQGRSIGIMAISFAIGERDSQNSPSP